MATQLQLRKGTKIQNDAFTGVEAELTYDTTTKGLRIHDGETQGGHEVPVLVAVQRPTAENNYTWFRKWSDGWVEQGGINRDTTATVSILLPVAMADNNYTAFASAIVDSATDRIVQVKSTSTASALDLIKNNASNTIIWQVSGMAA